jgi:hypothetical protein
MKGLAKYPILLLILLTSAMAAFAQGGPVRARMTMLSLYTKSDAVVIGRYNKREEAGVERVSDGFTVVNIKTMFDVTTVLKGEPRKFVTVESQEFRYQIQKSGEAPRDAVFVDDIASRKADDEPKPGDTVLVFLQNNGDTVDLTDDLDGVRKVTPAEQSIIESRIKELNSLFDGERPDAAKIAAWLIRCVENRATRWDGTHELLQGFRRMEWQSKPDPNGYERIDPSVADKYGLESAKALTPDMRRSLTRILVNSVISERQEKTISDGDRELITLVKSWDPEAAASAMLSLLKSGGFSQHENTGMMYRVAELLGDAQTAKLHQSYANVRKRLAATETKTDKQKSTLENILARFISTAESEIARRYCQIVN